VKKVITTKSKLDSKENVIGALWNPENTFAIAPGHSSSIKLKKQTHANHNENEKENLESKHIPGKKKEGEHAHEGIEKNKPEHTVFTEIVERILHAKGNTPYVAQKYYIPFNYVPPGGTASAYNYIQGIGSGNNVGEFTLVGTTGANVLAAGTYGTIFQGKLESASTSTTSGGTGTWTTMVVPQTFNSLGTSIYGVHNRGDKIYTLSGSYVSKDLTVTVPSGPIAGTYNQTLGWYYTGAISTTPDATNFKSFQAKGLNTATGQIGKADETYMHSISGNAIVGCYDFFGEGAQGGHGFVLDLLTGQQADLNFGHGYQSSAYAVWEAGKDDYVIAGGRTTLIPSSDPFTPGFLSSGRAIGEAVLSDYSLSGKTLSNIKTYQYQYKDAVGNTVQADETHFEGIYYCGNEIYETAFTAIIKNQVNLPVVGGVAFVKRDANGVFGDATWYAFDSPSGTTIAGNDSVWGNVSVGLQVPSGTTTSSTYACELNLAQPLA